MNAVAGPSSFPGCLADERGVENELRRSKRVRVPSRRLLEDATGDSYHSSCLF